MRSVYFVAALAIVMGAGCGPSESASSTPSGDDDSSGSSLRRDAGVPWDGHPLERAVVIMMENHDASEVYGSSHASFLNSLMKSYAYSENFNDVLPLNIPSEPHYVWLEAGTNSFSDVTFTNDADPSVKNSTASRAHLTALLDAKGVSWRTYQQSLSDDTGDCPIDSHLTYAAKHDPFVFFQDVAGSPPSKSNANCKAHHRSTSKLAADISSGDMAQYTLITPDLCNDMHSWCFHNEVDEGDDWLAANVKPLLTWALANRTAVFIAWDEGDHTSVTPFIVVAPGLKSAGYSSSVALSLSSLTRSLQDILKVAPADGVPYLAHAGDASTLDVSDFFRRGAYR